MKLIKGAALLSAGLAMAMFCSRSNADTWSYDWSGGSLLNSVSAYSDQSGNGGYFVANLYRNGSSSPFATGSFCNELGQTIAKGIYTPVATDGVISLDMLSGNKLGYWTQGGSGDSGHNPVNNPTPPAGGQAVQGQFTAGDVNLRALQYLVANNWTAATPGGSGNTAAKTQAMQLDIWHMWGFGNNAFNGTGNIAEWSHNSGSFLTDIGLNNWVAAANDASTDGDFAQLWEHQAIAFAAANTTYKDDGINWVRLASGSTVQDQIMYSPGGVPEGGPIVPEGNSLAMLSLGLFPILFGMNRMRKRSRVIKA